ncbi:unnamed protein product [Cutaneotrichosporon oleaginosum]
MTPPPPLPLWTLILAPTLLGLLLIFTSLWCIYRVRRVRALAAAEDAEAARQRAQREVCDELRRARDKAYRAHVEMSASSSASRGWAGVPQDSG